MELQRKTEQQFECGSQASVELCYVRLVKFARTEITLTNRQCFHPGALLWIPNISALMLLI